MVGASISWRSGRVRRASKVAQLSSQMRPKGVLADGGEIARRAGEQGDRLLEIGKAHQVAGVRGAIGLLVEGAGEGLELLEIEVGGQGEFGRGLDGRGGGSRGGGFADPCVCRKKPASS